MVDVLSPELSSAETHLPRLFLLEDRPKVIHRLIQLPQRLICGDGFSYSVDLANTLYTKPWIRMASVSSRVSTARMTLAISLTGAPVVMHAHSLTSLAPAPFVLHVLPMCSPAEVLQAVVQPVAIDVVGHQPRSRPTAKHEPRKWI